MSNVLSNYDRILDSAQDLIIAGGYNGFSYADIAEVVGIRKASIHHHFPTKVDLVVTLVTRYREEAEAGFTRLAQHVANPLDQLQAFVGHWSRCIDDGSRPICLCVMLASEMPMLPPEVTVEVRAYFRLLSSFLARTFEAASKQGLIVIAQAPAVEAELFMSTVHGAMLAARAHGETEKFSLITAAALAGMARKH